MVSEAVECYNALLQIAPSRERNYIIDQPNITVEERTALLNLFQGWEKKALILMPSNAELRRREEEAQFTEGKKKSSQKSFFFSQNPNVGDIPHQFLVLLIALSIFYSKPF